VKVSRKRVIASLLATAVVAITGATAAPGGAIVGGTFDGNGHPNVAYFEAYNASGDYLYYCTGTLVSPTVILTAAHCSGGDPSLGAIASMKATFDPDLTDGATPLAVTEWHPHPSYTQPVKNGTAQFVAEQQDDLGVVILAAPAVGVTQAPVVGLGGLNALTSPKKSSVFTVAGYGAQRENDPPRKVEFVYAGTRNTTTSGFKQLHPALLELSGNFRDAHNGGGVCFGDSGGPVFWGSTIVAVNTAGSIWCQASTLHVRLDTSPARAFLAQYVTL
jgi:secreted trypsin-like serine protease